MKKQSGLALRNSKGFTLIEVLVVVFIFGVALTAVSFMLSTNVRSAEEIKNNFIASGLAQEGMEVVRNIRDRDWFLGNAFGASIPDGSYRVQWNSQSLLPQGSNPNLKRDDNNGLISYDSGTDIIFKRTIEVSTVVANVEKKIVITVSWSDRGVTRSLVTEGHLFNWK